MSVNRKEAYFMSTTGKNKIRCLIWQDDSSFPIAIVQIAHGVAEHIERYDEFARYLAGNGFIVCGNDHLGHGKSVESFDKLSIMPDDGNVRIIDDMHKLHNIMTKKYPNLPYFIFGHSMGSFCARIYTSQFGDDLAGAVFCGTGEAPASLCLIETPLQYLVKKIGPEKKPKAVTKLFNKISCLGIKNPRTPCDWISFNEENVDKYIADPLCGDTFSLGLCRDLIKLASEACAFDWAYKVPKDLPILLISGSNDPVGFFGVGVQATCTNLETAGHKPNMVLYPNARHEVLNEDINLREQVYYDVLQWLVFTLSGMMKFNDLNMN